MFDLVCYPGFLDLFYLVQEYRTPRTCVVYHFGYIRVAFPNSGLTSLTEHSVLATGFLSVILVLGVNILDGIFVPWVNIKDVSDVERCSFC